MSVLFSRDYKFDAILAYPCCARNIPNTRHKNEPVTDEIGEYAMQRYLPCATVFALRSYSMSGT